MITKKTEIENERKKEKLIFLLLTAFPSIILYNQFKFLIRNKCLSMFHNLNQSSYTLFWNSCTRNDRLPIMSSILEITTENFN